MKEAIHPKYEAVWLLAHRGELHDDPVVFALRDRVSLVLVLVTGAVLAAATVA